MNHHPRCPHTSHPNPATCPGCATANAAEQDAYADAERVCMCHQVIVNDAQKCRNIAVECAGLIHARAEAARKENVK